MPAQAKWLLGACKLSKVEVLSCVAPCLNCIDFDEEGANAKATLAANKASVLAYRAALHAQERLKYALDVVLPAVWAARCQSSLQDFKDEVEESGDRYAREHDGRSAPEKRVGAFNRGAAIAIISAPRAVARSNRVRLKSDKVS
jgi:hypothetical protein